MRLKHLSAVGIFAASSALGLCAGACAESVGTEANGDTVRRPDASVPESGWNDAATDGEPGTGGRAGAGGGGGEQSDSGGLGAGGEHRSDSGSIGGTGGTLGSGDATTATGGVSGAGGNDGGAPICHDAGTMLVKKSVALLIMLDQSLSMTEPAATSGSTKWSIATTGIANFVNDPSSVGLDVGLAFFPTLTGNSGSCDGTGYDSPDVPIAPLPSNASAIASVLGQPTGLATPTEGGLRGATKYCGQYQKSHPSENCVVVFVTDGQPSTCNTNTTSLVQIVADAYAGGVWTSAIGMAAATAGEVDFGFLNAVAKAGGTNCNPGNPGNEACNVGSGSDMTTALDTIRSARTDYDVQHVCQ
jgi:hypothetical protein